MAIPSGWFYWAILSAVVAAMTAIFAKIGVHGVDSDLATLIRRCGGILGLVLCRKSEARSVFDRTE